MLLDMCWNRINKNEIETSAYRMLHKFFTGTLMLHWTGKLGLWRNLIKKVKLIISTKSLLRNQVDNMRQVFTEKNDYPLKVVSHIIVHELSHRLKIKAVETKSHDTEQKIQLLLPCSRKKGHQLLSKMKKQFKRTLPDDIKSMNSYKSAKFV